MSTDSAILQLAPTKQAAPLAQWMNAAKSNQSKGLASQVMEIAKLSRGAGKLTAAEYFKFQLYDDARFSKDEKRTFLGQKGAQKIYDQVISPYFKGLSHDKLISDALLSGAGLPSPKIFAHYHPVRHFRATHNLRTPDALADFLRDGMTYPFFEKPINGWESRGVAHVERFDSTDDKLILAGGRAVAVSTFANEIHKLENGAIFQELLSCHSAISAQCEGRVSTVRTVTLVKDADPQLFRAVWKIPANGNIADNFWRSGNLLADIDVTNGQVRRAVRGMGPDQEVLESHPDNGAALVGITLPLWEAIEELSKEVALLFPKLRIIACDIGMTDDGPVVVEVNAGGDMGLPQMASGKGVFDDQLQAFVAEAGPYKSLFAC